MDGEKSRAGSWRRLAHVLLVGFALLIFVADPDAQRRGGGGRARGGGGAAAGAGGAGADAPKGPVFLPGFNRIVKVPASTRKKNATGKGRLAQKKGAAQAKVDPMKEADEVTAAAERRARLEAEEQRVLLEHFRLCDLDANGWLSLRESEITLSFDRIEYRQADADQDGRITPAEFGARSALVLARLGAVPPAEPEPPTVDATQAAGTTDAATPAKLGPRARRKRAAAAADAEQPETPSALGLLHARRTDLLARYDADQSVGLSEAEIAKLFQDAGLTISPALVLSKMDMDTSGELTGLELLPLAHIAAEYLLRTAPPVLASGVDDAGEDAAVEDEEGEELEEGGDEASADPADPRTSAPSGPADRTGFGRLDRNHDGFVDIAELRALQNPVRLELRLETLLSAIDKDVDGRLSEAEFRASMQRGPR